MNFSDDAKLDALLRCREAVPVNEGLEQRIINAAKLKQPSSFNFVDWFNENFAYLSFAKTSYALSAMLFAGLLLGMFDYGFILESDYQVASDLFYGEEILL